MGWRAGKKRRRGPWGSGDLVGGPYVCGGGGRIPADELCGIKRSVVKIIMAGASALGREEFSAPFLRLWGCSCFSCVLPALPPQLLRVFHYAKLGVLKTYIYIYRYTLGLQHCAALTSRSSHFES